MIALSYLKQEAVNSLRDNIENNLELYRNGNFEHLIEGDVNTLNGDILIDEFLLKGMHCISNDRDVENSLLISQGIEGLTPYLARDERIWVYLTHTILLNYTRERWPIPEDDNNAISFISDHFFSKGIRGVMRTNSVARLWWAVHLSNKVEGLSLEDSLNTLLHRQDVRGAIAERPTISRSSVIFSSVIKVMNESYNTEEKELFDRKTNRGSMKELNFIAGARLLQGMQEEEVLDIVKGCFSRNG
ncbi:MAG: hypothetical protein ISR69_07930 [Gammaproteobacteria bacterium]|nr:hypothetical protein [Gammaproteobacteria bacterium]